MGKKTASIEGADTCCSNMLAAIFVSILFRNGKLWIEANGESGQCKYCPFCGKGTAAMISKIKPKLGTR